MHIMPACHWTKDALPRPLLAHLCSSSTAPLAHTEDSVDYDDGSSQYNATSNFLVYGAFKVCWCLKTLLGVHSISCALACACMLTCVCYYYAVVTSVSGVMGGSNTAAAPRSHQGRFKRGAVGVGIEHCEESDTAAAHSPPTHAFVAITLPML